MASSTTDIPDPDPNMETETPASDEAKPSADTPQQPQPEDLGVLRSPIIEERELDAKPVSPDSNTSKEEPKVPEELVHQSNRRAPVRFLQVEGIEGRTNDLVYCAPLQSEIIPENGVVSSSGSRKSIQDPDRRRRRELKPNESSKVVIYFGGDIQDFPEAMELHAEHRSMSNWNLEMTAVLLQNQFPEHHIVVVRPSRMQMLTYSCFDNFVPSNNIGVPDHTPNHGALMHLEALLNRLSSLIEMSGQNQNRTELNEKPVVANAVSGGVEDADSDCSPTSTSKPSESKPEMNGASASPVNPKLDMGQLSLVGFSKGCVVLNQFIYEFHYLKTLTPDDESLTDFLNCIEDMYWLDGGHNGTKNTWLTARSLLETLTRLEIRIHVHMTPYQLCDERRPWVHKEEQAFSESLRRYGAWIRRYVHFGDQPPSIASHLQLVAQFMAPSHPSTFLGMDDDEDEDYSSNPGNTSFSLMGSLQDQDADGNDEDDEDEELMYS